jgi:hypothetical protein
MSQYKVIASETVFGESSDGYQGAIGSALGHGHVESNASCEINVVIFNMRFEDGKFRVSIQIIVNEISPDKPEENLEKNLRPQYKNKNKMNENAEKLKKQEERRKRLHDLIDLIEFAHHSETLMAFNNEAIYDHLATSLHNTWEIHPQSQAYDDIYHVVKNHLDMPYQEIRLYTEAVDDISKLIPENTGFTRHFVDFAMEQQRHDLMQHMSHHYDHTPKPHNDNHGLRPKIVTQWDDK